MATNQTKSHPLQVRSAAALAVPGVLALTIPMIGFVASLLLPFFAARSRSLLWPRTSPIMGHLSAALAVTGLWLPALLAVASFGQLGSAATSWLLIPLCAPVEQRWWYPLCWPSPLPHRHHRRRHPPHPLALGHRRVGSATGLCGGQSLAGRL